MANSLSQQCEEMQGKLERFGSFTTSGQSHGLRVEQEAGRKQSSTSHDIGTIRKDEMTTSMRRSAGDLDTRDLGLLKEENGRSESLNTKREVRF